MEFLLLARITTTTRRRHPRAPRAPSPSMGPAITWNRAKAVTLDSRSPARAPLVDRTASAPHLSALADAYTRVQQARKCRNEVVLQVQTSPDITLAAIVLHRADHTEEENDKEGKGRAVMVMTHGLDVLCLVFLFLPSSTPPHRSAFRLVPFPLVKSYE
mmetsp:Transcript_9815/g.16132  ORF Transcript_9815/g.16132 Transcript_9815/m.16132 type:complete len:159 (+) Transcript_9815:317-793(+)